MLSKWDFKKLCSLYMDLAKIRKFLNYKDNHENVKWSEIENFPVCEFSVKCSRACSTYTTLLFFAKFIKRCIFEPKNRRLSLWNVVNRRSCIKGDPKRYLLMFSQLVHTLVGPCRCHWRINHYSNFAKHTALNTKSVRVANVMFSPSATAPVPAPRAY